MPNSKKYEDAIKALSRAIEQAEEALRDDQTKKGDQNLTNVFDDLKNAAKKAKDALQAARDKAVDEFKKISTDDIKKMSGKEILDNIKNNVEHLPDAIKEGVQQVQQGLAELDSAQQALVTNIGEAIVEGYRELTSIIDVDALVNEVSDGTAREYKARSGDNASFPACILVVTLALCGVAYVVEKFNPDAAAQIITSMPVTTLAACATYTPRD